MQTSKRFEPKSSDYSQRKNIRSSNMGYLILIRHGKSEYNAKGLWCGLTDVDLNQEGVDEARRAAEAIKDLPVDQAYVSTLKRSIQTLDEIKKTLNKDFPTTIDKAINERDYGMYTGQNKWQVKERIGEEAFMRLRRGWDVPIPKGESLKDVYNRVIPYFEQEILPNLKKGENVLVVAHGNSLRALVKKLDRISDADIPNLEFGTGEVYIYQFDKNGKILNKEIRAANPNKDKV